MFIKKLVMHGFKSFPRKTEIPFTEGINVIMGPNGSGKSNITDALCFVLGRLSIKSLRAAKAKNLIFMGTKSVQPAKEASVELVFDNSDNTFSIPEKEISLKRIVRKDGQSIYKINNQTKTRQEILTLLSQAGIDPNGFNIILQGMIFNFVKMHNEERRKVIEEVSGISVYELRKQKSLNELEKTDEKLKEVAAILRERTAHLNNLERERQEALKFKHLESQIKILKASIINQDLNLKKKEKEKILFEIDKRKKEIEKLKNQILSIQTSTRNFEEKIVLINSTIQKSTGLEQEKLNQEIANLRADLAGLGVRFENYENKIAEISRQKRELNELIKKNDFSIKDIKKSSIPESISKKQKEIDTKKKELEELEKERKKFYISRSELKNLRERFEEKRIITQNYSNESEFLIKQIKNLSEEIYDLKTTNEKVNSLKQTIISKKEILEKINLREREIEKISFLRESEVEKQGRLMSAISKIDICPVCKSKITKEHVHSIVSEVNPRVENLKKQLDESKIEINELHSKNDEIKKELSILELELSKREPDLLRISIINDKKEQIKNLQGNIENSEKELKEIEKRKNFLEKFIDENSHIEKRYETISMEMQEISLRNRENLDSEISFKQKELERSKISLKQFEREEEEYSEEAIQVKNSIETKEKVLENKKKQEELLSKKFQAFIQERDSHQKKIRELDSEISIQNNIFQNKERETNDLKIEIARIDASIENLETEILEFKEINIISSNREILTQKLSKAQETILRIGTVNLRSLEVYDSIKKEYDSVKEKTEIVSKEKEGILKIINEIDIKKKKTFLKTLTELNEKFSRNFSQLSVKGQVFLELENKKDPLEDGAGVQIIVKTGHGKYFDVTSLSGGEQTLVALSLIFAIQDLSPYFFYILDEIDAALDKRNSERLAKLLEKYIKKGQYIIVTHNDEIMLSAQNLYGVSMHEGISKIISLKI